ncbi:unnamed protein product, partial [Amoebophrya sp. A25]
GTIVGVVPGSGPATSSKSRNFSGNSLKARSASGPAHSSSAVGAASFALAVVGQATTEGSLQAGTTITTQQRGGLDGTRSGMPIPAATLATNHPLRVHSGPLVTGKNRLHLNGGGRGPRKAALSASLNNATSEQEQHEAA